MFSFGMISRLSIFVSLMSYIYLGNAITARVVFIISSYFAMLNQSMVFFWPYSMSKVAEAVVSIQRVQEFLLMSEEKLEMKIKKEDEEKLQKETTKQIYISKTTIIDGEMEKLIPDKLVIEELLETDKSITIKNATAYWVKEDQSSVGIEDFSLNIEQKELCAIVGPVGSGKSSVLEVILGELQIDSGHSKINGTISYAAQEGWLFEGTIRSNIVFIETFNEARYNQVIQVCALERDLTLFPLGDMTIVGEKGVSLSGGQKARVNLARAIYKKADIYLLDDPLSAVDTHVGKYLFKECIEGFLGDKIRILVTHQLQYLTSVRNLVLLNKGKVDAQGTYEDLCNLQLESLSLLPAASDEIDLDVEDHNLSAIAWRAKKLNDTAGALAEDDRVEKQGTGAVRWDVYKQYVRALSGVQYVLVLFIVSQFAMTGLEFFIATW